ncbi:MAG: HrpJ domain-containing protein [Pseudomonadota bacterium]
MSEINVSRQQVASANVQGQVGQEIAEQIQGNRKGDSATAVKNTNSDISKLQEEIGNSVAKLADKRSLGQAKVRQGQGVNFEALKRIADYYDKLPDMPRDDELRQLVEKFKKFESKLEGGGGSGGGDVTPEDILKLLQDFDGDVTHQYAGLQVARRYFESTDGSEALTSLLDKANEYFEKTDVARNVQAGFAIAKAASDTADLTGADPAKLRDNFREMLRGPMNMGQLFDELASHNLGNHFDEIVGLFLETAGNELAGTTSLTDPILLKGLVTELGKLKEMRTVFHSCDELIQQTQRIDKTFANGANAGGPTELTSAILNFCSKPTPNLSDARLILKDFKSDNEGIMVVFANGLHELHRSVSNKSVVSDAARLHQSTALTALKTDLTEIEEQAYETKSQGTETKKTDTTDKADKTDDVKTDAKTVDVKSVGSTTAGSTNVQTGEMTSQ